METGTTNKKRLLEALESGCFEEALRLMQSESEDVLVECHENKSSLHLIASLTDKNQAIGLCRQFLHKIQDVENRERLLNATVVEQFVCSHQTIHARAAAIHIAAYNGNMGVVRVLCDEYGVDINCSTSNTIEERPKKGLTPLYWAAVNGQTELVKMLIDITDVNVNCTEDGDRALHVASRNGHIALMNLLLEQNADVNARKNTNATPVYVAAMYGHTDAVQLLLDNKADLNATRSTGSTPLYIAAYYGLEEVVILLLLENADVNASKHDGATPLHAAARKGHTAIAKLLVDHKANINARMQADGATPLDVAVENGHTEVVDVLTAHKALVNASDTNGILPLNISGQNERNEAVGR